MKASYNILFSITRYCYDIILFMHTASDLYGKVSKLFTIFIFKLLNSFLNFNVKFFENKKQINYKKTIPKTIPKYYIEGGITIYLPNCIKLSINKNVYLWLTPLRLDNLENLAIDLGFVLLHQNIFAFSSK